VSIGRNAGFQSPSLCRRGGPPSGRPTSELLGSVTFQTPEGEPLTQILPRIIFFVLLPPYAHLLFPPADAIDQWFEKFHYCEVKPVSIFDHLSRHQISTANATIFSRRKRWLLPLF
jgi:hypothetical protein